MSNRYAVRDITKRINNSDRLSEVLLPENYAMKDQWAEEIAKNHLKNTNNNQLRKFFTDIKTVESHLSDSSDFEKYKREIWLLVPKIAYAAGRNLVDKKFFELIAECLNSKKIKDIDDYIAFVDFYTAVIAYAKFYSNNQRR